MIKKCIRKQTHNTDKETDNKNAIAKCYEEVLKIYGIDFF